MSRLKQARFALRCVVWDLMLGEWQKIAFHWRGFWRAMRGKDQ